MSKKDPTENLKKRIKNLENKMNELVIEFNDSQTEHRQAFGMVARDIKALQNRLASMENAMLMGDFKAKIAKGGGLSRL